MRKISQEIFYWYHGMDYFEAKYIILLMKPPPPQSFFKKYFFYIQNIQRNSLLHINEGIFSTFYWIILLLLLIIQEYKRYVKPAWQSSRRPVTTFKRRKKSEKPTIRRDWISSVLFCCREIKVALVTTPTQRRQGEWFAWATAAKLRASMSRGTPESRAASVTTLLRRL